MSELPEPSAELTLLLAFVRAYVRSLPKKERTQFLADVDEALGLQEAAYNVIRFRPKSADPAVFAAMRQARAWYRQALAVALRLGE